jgi:hypothetical protein
VRFACAVVIGWWWHLTPLLAQSSSTRKLKADTEKKPKDLGSSEVVLFLREAMRAIASLGCEGAMRAKASSMSPHVTPQQGPTPILLVFALSVQNNRSNRQRRREDTANDPSS